MNVALTENGEYRSTYDILKDIAAQWKNLTSMEQAAIAEALAGNRQQTVLMSIISNFQEASGAMEAMANSSGELRESYATYMESAEAHINQLKAAFESLAQSLFNSDSIKTVVDMLAGMLTTLDNIVKTIGGVPTIITGIAAALSMVKNVGIFKFTNTAGGIGQISSVLSSLSNLSNNKVFTYSSGFNKSISQDVISLQNLQTAINGGIDKTEALERVMAGASSSAIAFARNNDINRGSIRGFVTDQRMAQVSMMASNKSIRSADSIIKTYNGNLTKLKLNQQQFKDAVSSSNPVLGNYLNSVKSGEASTKGYIASLVGAKVASIGLQVATMLLNAALAALVSIAVSAFFNVISQAINAAKNRMEEANNSLRDLSESLKTLDDYKEKAVELRKELDKGGLSLSDVAEKRKELYDIQKNLIDKYGAETKGIDLVTGSIEKQIVAIDKLSKKENEEWLRKHRKAVEEAREYLHNDYWDAAKNYLEVRPFEEGYRSSGQEAFTEWLKEWISKNFTNSEITATYSKGQSTDSGVPELLFHGSREQIVANYDKLYDAVSNYLETAVDISKRDKKNIDAMLNALSGAKNFVVNDDYNGHKENYEQATEIVAQTKGAYKAYYDDLLKLNKEYDNAVAKNDEAAAEKSYKAIVDKYNEIIKNGSFRDTDNVRGEDIKAYFEGQFNDFMNLSIPIRLKVDIEGTKREFDSSYEDLISMYSKVGDKGFVIGNVDYRGIPAGVEGYSDVTIAQASEFNAIRDAAKEAGVSIESYIEALVQYGKVQKKVAGTQTEELSITKYSEDIKKAQDAISPLLDAYNKLQNGELSNSDIVTLISDKFPSLIKYTDNLSVGIQKLAGEKLEELKTKLSEVDRSKLSEDDLKAYDKFIEYIDKLNDGFSSTVAYYEKIQSQTKSVSDSITTLIGLSKEIDENGGLSLSSMEKILSDDSLTSLRPYLNDVKTMLPIINGLIDDQKQAYEDLYNEQQRLADPDAYIEASQEKQEEDENAFQNAVKRINEQIAKFKAKYGVDLTNWEQLEDGKKSILQSTNAELLSKQWKLINDFATYYNTDLKNFKNTTEAKAKILESFNTTAGFKDVTKMLDAGNSVGVSRYVYDKNSLIKIASAPVNRENINKILEPYGLTWEDYVQYVKTGEFTSSTMQGLEDTLNSIVNTYTISPDTWNDATKNIGASGGSSGSSSSGSKEKTWFEKQYAYHNHLVNMEQEKQQDYLNWLNGAYKRAYSQGIIDLDAYYKYEEEVYNGRKKLTGETDSWFEKQYKRHQHLLKMEKEDEADYLKWLSKAYKKAYSEGLITLDEYRKYQEEVYDGVKKLKDNVESAINNLINIRINMLKEDIDKEKEAIKKKLDFLKDFYQKQKDMLQDKYDQEKYLDEQSEKRKKVSDIKAKIAALTMDDSTKAQKMKAELAVELKDAEKDLDDFEKDHTLKQTQDDLDTLYNNKEKKYNKKLDDLEKKSNSPHDLYTQALKDVRKGSVDLYNEMIKWNNEYGDGIKKTIKNAWEEAYKAEKQYYNYTGKHYNNVNLSNATGYVKKKSGYASGTSHSTAGLHMVDEQGIETIFQSTDGQRYRMFSSGEKVLNTSASDFLYKFANKGKEILDKLFNSTSHSYNNVNPGVVANTIQQGDIIIQGNADKATVSEIRRAQRENLEQMLKQLNRLK